MNARESATFDPRVAAFCSPEGPEVFSGIVHGSQVWTADPFDVEHIHAEARLAFRRLLDRASSDTLPPTGKTLLLLGDGGSGKTHLMRAFRTATHAQGDGYCAYLQMTSRSDNYARYVLANVVDSLEQPYRPDAPTTGAMRLARGLLDAVQTIAASEREQLLRGDLPEDVVVRLVNKVATTAVRYPRFAKLDLDLLRAVLFLLPNDGLVHAVALKWLRCEELSRFDRELLGDLVPRSGPEWPLRTLVGLGKLMSAVRSSAFVLLVDQMEEVIELSGPDGEGSVLRSAINTLVDVADALPNAVVVMACLSDLFVVGRQYLPGPKLDRLLQDPEPVKLEANRDAEQIEAIVAKRMEVLLDAFELEPDPQNPCAPFTPEHLAPLAGRRTRDVLGWCRTQHERCQVAGTWVEPEGFVPAEAPAPPPEIPKIGQTWNDFLAEWSLASGLSQESFADLLAFCARLAVTELPAGVRIEARADGRFVRLDVTVPGGAPDSRLVAVCDASARGGALERQIEEVVVRAGSLPAIFVRSTDFSKGAKTKIAARLADLCKPIGIHRKLVVQNADWRTMDAFRAFHEQHSQDKGFTEWMRSDCPLTGLPSLRAILEVEHLLTEMAKRKARAEPPPLTMSDAASKDETRDEAEDETEHDPASPLRNPAPMASFRLGWTGGVAPVPVEMDPARLTQHAAFLGGSGSGKTTAALVMVEALLLRGIPVVLVDRKGDLCRYADPSAWTEPEPDADRRAARARLREAIEVELFTPGASEGRPLGIPVAPVDLHLVPSTSDREQLAGYAAMSLGQMMGYRTKSHLSKIAILQKAIEVLGAVPDRAVTVPALHALVRDRDRALLVEVDGLDDRHYRALAEDLQTLWLRHRRLLDVEEMLDIDTLLGRGRRKTRLSIVSTQGLGDEATVDFWVSQLLVAIERWGARHPSQTLQAVFLFDEADRYLPAVGRPPSTKAPMEHLLKRARSAGIGLMLSTQSPGDFDYKCREQVLTWLVGRVNQKTAITKLKPLLDAARIEGDRLAGLATGQFLFLTEGEAQPVEIDLNLLPTRQLAEETILQLAKAARDKKSTD